MDFCVLLKFTFEITMYESILHISLCFTFIYTHTHICISMYYRVLSHIQLHNADDHRVPQNLHEPYGV